MDLTGGSGDSRRYNQINGTFPRFLWSSCAHSVDSPAPARKSRKNTVFNRSSCCFVNDRSLVAQRPDVPPPARVRSHTPTTPRHGACTGATQRHHGSHRDPAPGAAETRRDRKSWNYTGISMYIYSTPCSYRVWDERAVPCATDEGRVLKCNEGPTAICTNCPPFVEGP